MRNVDTENELSCPDNGRHRKHLVHRSADGLRELRDIAKSREEHTHSLRITIDDSHCKREDKGDMLTNISDRHQHLAT
jgi:hypothetical protein